ncbi:MULTISPECIES: Sec-independent protein translocase subunit TatA [Streptomyces]|uniref:Sec-independent protein translocase protein TatA n=1 Tax=Streptomyces koyangensis TaxID=188770 RepID=A0A385DEU0_9ACTN|nr:MULTISPECIES: Sec-independent protein translocase subunit TatA [Streptomyces]AXQ56341.1 Sec-independent protein translocase subunit TatA [Streptomyces koyangensis]PKR41478.1 twin-arginine translocase TatA/TatE family subunit [Streptomyces sp. EAG2]WTD03664.1 Sec-independent protein translocase subunit TatA [Streptomyces albidoflavus]
MYANALKPWHLLIVALVVIVLFGSKKLPDAARGLGRSLRILKSEARALKEEEGAAATPAEQAKADDAKAGRPAPPAA